MNAALLRFLVVLCAGFLGAAATGKLVPHARWLTDTYGVSLGMAGFAISAVMLPGAILSAGLGVITDRLGARNVMVAGLAISGIASMLLGSAVTASFSGLILMRLAEGIGYCLLVIGGTVLVVEGATEKRRTLALSVWSSFAPIGFALGQWASSAQQGDDRLATIGWTHGIALLILGAIAFAVMPRTKNGDSHLFPASASPVATSVDGKRWLSPFFHRPALMASLAFGCVTGVLLAAVAVTPLILAKLNGIAVGDAARLTAIAALPGIAGRFAAGWLLGWRLTPLSVLTTAGLGGVLSLALALLFELPLATALVLFTAFQILVGVIPGVLSAMIPQVAPSREHIGTVSGLVNQMVTTGNLVGPPLILSIYAAADTMGAVLALAAFTALCAYCVARVPVFRAPIG